MKVELMRYRNDSKSYYFVLAGLALDAVYLMVMYSSAALKLVSGTFTGIGVVSGIDILYHIVFLLFAFLTAEKVKTYTLNWGFVSLGLGVLQLPRILFPIKLYLLEPAQLSTISMVSSIILLVLSAGLMIAGCYFSITNSRKLDKYLKEIGGGI